MRKALWVGLALALVVGWVGLESTALGAAAAGAKAGAAGAGGGAAGAGKGGAAGAGAGAGAAGGAAGAGAPAAAGGAKAGAPDAGKGGGGRGGGAPPAAAEPIGPVTAKQVEDAIEKARTHILEAQHGDGFWQDGHYSNATGNYGDSEMAVFTLIYTAGDKNPMNDPRIVKGLDAIITRPLDYTYAISMRCMALAHALKYLTGNPKRELIKKAMETDAMWLSLAQSGEGGWGYKSIGGAMGQEWDLSNSQLAILALREAALAGAEIKPLIWQRAQNLYMKDQHKDGSWNYGSRRTGNPGVGGPEEGAPGYGSMTAAGLASLFICMDNLDLASGCPCRGATANPGKKEFEKRIDLCLTWLEKNFTATANPRPGGNMPAHILYWLYSVERVGLAAGYKYFGNHNWFQEGAANLVKTQQPSGAWGELPDTCFGVLFLYKGMAPIIFNKLQETPGGEKWDWNPHRRDVANLVTYFQRTYDNTQYAWQIVSLRGTNAELHEAPILYISAESAPKFTPEEEKKLREFTDTGGTILFEASCGNPAVRAWFRTFSAKLWPEWPLKPLGPDHPTFVDRFKLPQRPEILGMDDGVRTFLFYAMDDVSCPWQTKAYTAKEYLFKWAVNLITYATEHSPIRGKLEERREPVVDRYTTPAKAAKAELSVARVKYGDPSPAWLTGRNYKTLDLLAATLKQKAAVTLKIDDTGVAPGAITADIAYLSGAGTTLPNDAERAALKAFAAKGGFIWIEAAAGSMAWDQEFRKMATDMKWELKDMTAADPAMTGKFPAAVGFDVTKGMRFRFSLRTQRLGAAAKADILGIYQDGKLVGVYTPLDVTFSLTDYDAGGCRGYLKPDAAAVATNVILLAGDRGN